ncbi:MAG: SPOR domain-containing protein [Gammaproteobacteria bacterium]|nr:SPOR domain-containing protein [Gammaproteobacteria bacterium]
MWQIEHKDRRHRIVGLVFYALVVTVLMVVFLDGSGYRAWLSTSARTDNTYELVELKKINPSKVAKAAQAAQAAQATKAAQADKTAKTAQVAKATKAAQAAKVAQAIESAKTAKTAKPAQDDAGKITPAAASRSGAEKKSADSLPTDSDTSHRSVDAETGISARPSAKLPTGKTVAGSESAPVSQPSPADARLGRSKLPPPAAGTLTPGDSAGVAKGALAPDNPSTAPPQWFVQAASYKSEKNAVGLASKLRSLFDSIIIETAEIGQQKYYRVKIGPLDDEPSAKVAQRRLTEFGIISPRIIAPLDRSVDK